MRPAGRHREMRWRGQECGPSTVSPATALSPAALCPLSLSLRLLNRHLGPTVPGLGTRDGGDRKDTQRDRVLEGPLQL